MNLRKYLSFGFEQTFTTPEWWADPGFVATSNTALKIEKMKMLAENIASVQSGRFVESKDIYGHLQYETFDAQGLASYVVTMDPGSIEVKSPPLFIDGMTMAMHPLFVAAERSGLVPYRNWWYGIRTGTEGGCHINMAGMTEASNPLKQDPVLVLKYAAFFHNHPCLHYPFMGVDVGPGGNCMRMDEHALDPHSHHAPGSLDSMERFAVIADRVNNGEVLNAEKIAEHFEGSKLAEDKHSAPSLYKYKAPLFFIEDRAVESLRGADEFFLLSDLRLRILEQLQTELKIRPLKVFGAELHQEKLSSVPLWIEFQEMCRELQLDAGYFRCFFDRQFPVLKMGEGCPPQMVLREGRRPRTITGIQMRGKLIISKTVETSFARLEIHSPPKLKEDQSCVINQLRIPVGKARCIVLDYQKSKLGKTLDIAWIEKAPGRTVFEKARFNSENMMFQVPDFEVDFDKFKELPQKTKAISGCIYVNLEGL